MNGVYLGVLLLGANVLARSVDEWPVVSLDNENGRLSVKHQTPRSTYLTATSKFFAQIQADSVFTYLLKI